MEAKTIRVREDIYREVEARQRPDESSSELLARLMSDESQFERRFGALSDVDFEAGLDRRFQNP